MKKFLSILITIAVLMFVMIAQPPMNANAATIELIKNGGFEQGIFNTNFILSANNLPSGSPSATAKTPVRLNEKITVEYSNFPGNKTDWVTIVPVGTPDKSYKQYFFTRGSQSGTMSFNDLPAGDYEVRGYFNCSAGDYKVQTRSTFSVSENTTPSSSSFSESCYNSGMYYSILYSTCKMFDGTPNQTYIDLNPYIENVDGKLLWQPANFINTCRYSYFFEPSILGGECQTRDREWIPAWINLGDRIVNVNGNLTYK